MEDFIAEQPFAFIILILLGLAAVFCLVRRLRKLWSLERNIARVFRRRASGISEYSSLLPHPPPITPLPTNLPTHEDSILGPSPTRRHHRRHRRHRHVETQTEQSESALPAYSALPLDLGPEPPSYGSVVSRARTDSIVPEPPTLPILPPNQREEPRSVPESRRIDTNPPPYEPRPSSPSSLPQWR